MPYAIQTTDKPDSGTLRAKMRDEHIKYLDANLHRLLAGDPYTKAGLFQRVTVTRWRKAYFNKQKFV